jgi:hypothetical protein
MNTDGYRCGYGYDNTYITITYRSRGDPKWAAFQAHFGCPVLYAVAPPLFSFQAKHDVELELFRDNYVF